ncbi:hypothetical protein D3C71_2243670 [compost metagenome]
MVEIVEHQPADGNCLKILVSRVAAHDTGVAVLRLHRQRNEHHEAVCLVLQLTDLQHMTDAVLA